MLRQSKTASFRDVQGAQVVWRYYAGETVSHCHPQPAARLRPHRGLWDRHPSRAVALLDFSRAPGDELQPAAARMGLYRAAAWIAVGLWLSFIQAFHIPPRGSRPVLWLHASC